MSYYESQLGQYPTPINISYAWSFGSLSGISMILQAFSGIVLATIYVPVGEGEFNVTAALEYINRDAYYGWLIRSMHANTPSLIFLWMYLHMGRSMLIGSRPVYAWVSGWLMLVLTIVVAFLGYTCVWGNMSYWAATVITSLVTVLPGGYDLLAMLWGGPVVGQATLTRFLTFHYLLALVLVALMMVHIVAVHYTGSSSPLQTAPMEKVPFMQYYVIKDAISTLQAFIFSLLLILLMPTATMDTELYIGVNTMSTPEHILPEWYLLPWYAILRCVPNKTMGLIYLCVVLVQLLLVCVKDE